MKIKSKIFRLAKRAGLSGELIKFNLIAKRFLGIKQKDFSALYDFYRQFIKKDSVVFDIGANVGNRTEVFLALGAHVVAIEPNSKLVSVLRSRFRNKKVDILNVGMGEKTGSREFSVASNTLVSSFSSKFMNMKESRGEHDDWNRKVVVDIETLDRIITKFGKPDFCKIDVEGYEQEVLSGLSTTFPNLSFEFTSPDFNEETIWCVNKLKDVGFKEFNISYKESLRFEFKEWMNADSMIKYLQDDVRMREKWYGDVYARS